MTDRIDYDEDGELDDVSLQATSVHIERLDDDRVWLAVERPDGDRFTFEFSTTRTRGVVDWVMVEGSIGSLT